MASQGPSGAMPVAAHLKRQQLNLEAAEPLKEALAFYEVDSDIILHMFGQTVRRQARRPILRGLA